MPYWYEVFDNEEVQYATRRRAAMLSCVLGAAVAVTVLCLAVSHAGTAPAPVVGVVLLVMWVAIVRWFALRISRLRRVVWCVKISDRQVVGYDYTRKKTELDWTRMDRVALTPSGLVLSGPGGAVLEIPHLFPDFAELSHRIVHHAEFYRVPVFVDDQPWQEIDVYDLYPFLPVPSRTAPPPTH